MLQILGFKISKFEAGFDLQVQDNYIVIFSKLERLYYLPSFKSKYPAG